MIKLRSFLFLISFLCILNVKSQERGNASPFVTIPQISQKILDAQTVQEVKNIYSDFLKQYPYEKFYQATFLLDKVAIAATTRLLEMEDDSVLNYLFQIENHNERWKLIESMNDKYRNAVLKNALWDLLYQKQKEQTTAGVLKYAEFLYYFRDVKEAEEYMGKLNVEKYIPVHPLLFSKVFIETGKAGKAVQVLAKLVKEEKGDEYTNDMLERAWTMEKGSREGFDSFYNRLIDAIKDRRSIHLGDKIVYYSAPQFSLADLKGNKVSKDDLKGKVVFIDFWATWCGPCLASFPTMKKVVEHYQNNKDVVFLFVNTLENEEGRISRISEVLKKYETNFETMLDFKKGDVFENASNFKVNGIPAQFIIDKNGFVRFALKGYDGKPEGTIEEIKLMIESALKH